MQLMSIKGIIGFTLMAVAIHMAGCGSEPIKHPGFVDILLSAPEQIEIEGQHYVLECHLSRDFEPGNPPDGSPLRVLVRVTERDSLDIPQNIDATKIWVINEDAVWDTVFAEKPRSPIPFFQFSKFASGGPKWGPHIFVDVVVGIGDEKGHSYLLKAANQWIYRDD